MSNENKTEWDVVSGGRVACPYCDEDISINAKICKHCKSVLNTTSNDYGKKDVIEKSVLRTKAAVASSRRQLLIFADHIAKPAVRPALAG